MILDLEPIFNNEGMVKEFSYELDLSDQELSGVKPFSTPVRVSGSVGNHTGVVELSAKAEFVLDMNCDRCAKPIKLALTADVFHTLVTSLNDEANDELLLVNELRFDLDPLVTEDIFLELPSKFLCSEDCKGVCPKCGKDLNTGSCSCEKEIDPRLAALKQLLDN
ncbi:MAG: YceD family protein [Acutalibacteraceae bacterium]